LNSFDESARARKKNEVPDPLFSGYGSPAYMSIKEPGLRLLHERYGDTFAVTKGTHSRVHLFMIKVGLWALVYTFTPKDLGGGERRMEITDVLNLLEQSMSNGSSLGQKIDESVKRAKDRIRIKAQEFGVKSGL
jgi:hypothetical protein